MLSLPTHAQNKCQDVIDAADAVIRKQDEMLGLCQKNYGEMADDNTVLARALLDAQEDAADQRQKTLVFSVAGFILGVIAVSAARR